MINFKTFLLEQIRKYRNKPKLNIDDHNMMTDMTLRGEIQELNTELHNDSEMNHYANRINEIIHNYRTIKSMKVWRGISSHNSGMFKLGKVIMRGFQSTSTNQNIAEKIMKSNIIKKNSEYYKKNHGYLFHINLPKGSHAFDVDKTVGPYRGHYGGINGTLVNTTKGQKEVLLPHAAKYHIHKIEEHPWHTDVHMTYKGL